MTAGRGIALVTGAAGLGKTLLCRALVEELRAGWTTILLDRGSLGSRRGLLDAILAAVADAGPIQHAKELELRLHLHYAIRQARSPDRGLVAIVDEAETAHPEALDELAVLGNPASHPPLLRVVLAGRPEIFDALSRPDCQTLAQCITTRHELQPLTPEESRGYIVERLRQAGRPAESVFTEEALELAARVGGGNPRSINQLGDHSLLLAYISDDKPVTASVVREALQDLQSLPGQTAVGLAPTGAPAGPNRTVPTAPPAEAPNRQPESTVAPRLVVPTVPNHAENFSLTNSISSPTGVAGLPPSETSVYEVGAGIPSKQTNPWFQLLSRPPEPAPRLPETDTLPPSSPKELQLVSGIATAQTPVRFSETSWEQVEDRYARMEAGLPIPPGYPPSVQPEGMPREFHTAAWHVGNLPDWEGWDQPPQEQLIRDPWLTQPALISRKESAPRKSAKAESGEKTPLVETAEWLRVYTAENDDLAAEAPADDPTRYLLANLPSEQFYRGQASPETAEPHPLSNSSPSPDQLLDKLIPLVDEFAQEYQPVPLPLPAKSPEAVRQPIENTRTLPTPPVPSPDLNPPSPERKQGRFSQLFTRLRQRAFGQE